MAISYTWSRDISFIGQKKVAGNQTFPPIFAQRKVMDPFETIKVLVEGQDEATI